MVKELAWGQRQDADYWSVRDEAALGQMRWSAPDTHTTPAFKFHGHANGSTEARASAVLRRHQLSDDYHRTSRAPERMNACVTATVDLHNNLFLRANLR